MPDRGKTPRAEHSFVIWALGHTSSIRLYGAYAERSAAPKPDPVTGRKMLADLHVDDDVTSYVILDASSVSPPTLVTLSAVAPVLPPTIPPVLPPTAAPVLPPIACCPVVTFP